MPYTQKQLQAIETTGTNILVSAGAGSGKTTVLSARVMRILKSGKSISNMLILTFTNNAAHNMREKIKQDIKKNLNEFPQLKEQYDLVDTADIMTFDAYNQKLLKRYFYRLGISRDFSIVDSSLMNVQLTKIIRKTFDELYEREDPTFLHILDKYTVKNDKDIFSLIQSIVLEEQKLSNWQQDIEKKISDPYSNGEILNKTYRLAVDTIKEEIAVFLSVFNYCQDDDPAYFEIKEKTLDAFRNYRDIASVEDAKNMYQAWADLKLKKKRKNSDFKLRYDPARKHFNNRMKGNSTKPGLLLSFPSKAQAEYILNSKRDETVFLYKLARKVLVEFFDYKRANQVYDFSDIANYSLRLLRENADIRNEVRDSYFEIMVDEYQDNSDLQEEFLRLISNNNLFMVGDVKQSIYRFRNSNPTYFMNRYYKYSRNDGGVLIDMNDNFRSSPSVVSDINSIFSRIMFADFGGADYKVSHCIKAGNTEIAKVDNLKTKQFNYTFGSKDKVVAKFEAQIICEDIIKRINSKELIGVDQHEARFSDFCLLCDRGSKFEEIAKVFKDYKIPLKVETNKEVSDQIIVLLIKSLFSLYSCVESNDFSSSAFKHALLSIARSAFCKYSQEKLNRLFTKDLYLEDEIVKRMQAVYKKTAGQDVKTIFLALIEEFKVYEAIKDFVSPSATFQFLQAYESIIDSMAKLRYTSSEVTEYFQTLKEEKIQVQLYINSASSNSVILTNIHKSKGLEYPIVYYIGLGSKYRNSQYPRGFFYSQFTGIVLPFVKSEFSLQTDEKGKRETIANPLLEVYKLIEDNQDYEEKVRLFYVGLTRAKYQMIFVEPAKEYTPGSLTLKRCRSFLDLLNCANFVGNIRSFTPDDLCHKCYQVEKQSMEKLPVKFTYEKIVPSYVANVKKTASIGSEVHVDESLLKFGTYLHKVMESIDFKNPNLEYVEDEKVKRIAERFINSDLIKEHLDWEFYPEYEYFDPVLKTFGSVDLLAVGKEGLLIVDYKLKNISDEGYKVQLETYKRNMENIFKKEAECYLYSLVDSTYVKIC